MTVIIVQHNKAYAAFGTTSKRDLKAVDVRRAAVLAGQSSCMEMGYYDVLLITGHVPNHVFNEAAMEVPRHWYTDARDHVIGVK